MTRRAARWLDARLGSAKFARSALGKVFPDHWSFLLGELALYSFVVLVATGVYLTFFFHPGTESVRLRRQLRAAPGRGDDRGLPVSAVELSFDVRAGLVMRQIHHWAALLFIAAIVVHLMRIFFTGAFRRPRELNWMVGVTLLILAIFNGFAGYSLLDDQLSGTGLRIAYSITLSIPLGGHLAGVVPVRRRVPGPRHHQPALRDPHPAAARDHRRAHRGAPVPRRPPQAHAVRRARAGPRTTWSASAVWPSFAFKSIGLMLLVAGLLAALGGLAQINPIWLYGPFDPAEVSSASQPDWYMGWLDGALRLFPPWEIRAFGYELPAPVLPGGAARRHHLRAPLRVAVRSRRCSPATVARTTCSTGPATGPVRTSLGVATLGFYAVLTLAASNDVIATTFGLSVNAVVVAFRVLSVVLPPIAAGVTYRLCNDLQARDIANGIRAAAAAPHPHRAVPLLGVEKATARNRRRPTDRRPATLVSA